VQPPDIDRLEQFLRRTLYNLAADGWRRRSTAVAGLRRWITGHDPG